MLRLLFVAGQGASGSAERWLQGIQPVDWKGNEGKFHG